VVAMIPPPPLCSAAAHRPTPHPGGGHAPLRLRVWQSACCACCTAGQLGRPAAVAGPRVAPCLGSGPSPPPGLAACRAQYQLPTGAAPGPHAECRCAAAVLWQCDPAKQQAVRAPRKTATGPRPAHLCLECARHRLDRPRHTVPTMATRVRGLRGPRSVSLARHLCASVAHLADVDCPVWPHRALQCFALALVALLLVAGGGQPPPTALSLARCSNALHVRGDG
jgi:hypothetical protein